MRRAARLGALAVLAAVPLLAACAGEDDEFANAARGRGMRVAPLPAGVQARIYESALRAGFDLGPDLVLLADTRLLPRAAGLEGTDPLDPDVVLAMQRRNVVRGTCEPPVQTRENPRCPSGRPGYVVRFSPVFQAPGDTVQVHVAARRYDTPDAAATEVLRFEKVYQLVEAGTAWRVVREARAPGGEQ